MTLGKILEDFKNAKQELANIKVEIASKKQSLYRLNTQIIEAEFKKQQIENTAKEIMQIFAKSKKLRTKKNFIPTSLQNELAESKKEQV